MSSKVEKRRIEIMNIVNIEGKAYVNELSKIFNVTTETIRADLDFLVASNELKRIHGGVIKEKTERFNLQYKYHERQTCNIEAKKKICFRAIDLLDDGDCIYVDNGSTVTFLLNFLNRRENITLVTSSIALLMKYILEDYAKVFNEHKHKLIFIGGEVDTNILTTYGTFFNQTVEDFNFDKMLISVDAINLKNGCTNVDYESYAIIKSVSKNTNKKIVLVDKSKFGRIATHKVIGWESIDFIVTDNDLDEQWLNLFKRKKIEYDKI